MADSEGIKEIVNQVAIQAAMAVIMSFRDMTQHPSQPQPQTSERHKSRSMENQY